MTDQRIQELIEKGEIVESDGNLWELPAPNFRIKGKSASVQLLEERETK
jgi:hypothetical protein